MNEVRRLAAAKIGGSKSLASHRTSNVPCSIWQLLLRNSDAAAVDRESSLYWNVHTRGGTKKL